MIVISNVALSFKVAQIRRLYLQSYVHFATSSAALSFVIFKIKMAHRMILQPLPPPESLTSKWYEPIPNEE